MFLSQHQIEQIRGQSLQMEQDREVTEEALQLIYDHRLFHLFVPNEWNGRMTSLPEAVKIFQECARMDGNLGWLVTIGAGGGFFVPFMSPKVSQNVFAHRTAVIAGSGTPSGTAQRVPGGYKVNGSWKYCSGSTHATVFTANVIVEPGEDSAVADDGTDQEIRSVILKPEQVHITPDWNAFGLKATSSHSISVKDAFVPEEMTFDITDKKAFEHELIYSYPFLAFARASFAAVTLGIAEHLLEAAEALLEQKPSHPYVINQLINQKEALQRSEEALDHWMNQSWRELQQEGQLSQETESKVSEQCITTAQDALQCGQVLFPLLGLSAAIEDSPVNRTWRDLQTACQHVLLRRY